MEVHAHTHPDSYRDHRKKWTHYFWEFIMLFLAVFCGFLAENIREHTIEKHKAKEFARSLFSDLKADTAVLQYAIAFANVKINAIDSLFTETEMPVEKWNDTLVYKYTGLAARIRPFERSSGTYKQMKSSGSLRYFKQELADLLNKYDVQDRKTKARENIMLKIHLDQLIPIHNAITDTRAIIQIQDGLALSHPLVFRKTDKETMALWINNSATLQGTQERTLTEYNGMLTKANQIIEVLKKEYRLD